jgi:hypothetical protein
MADRSAIELAMQGGTMGTSAGPVPKLVELRWALERLAEEAWHAESECARDYNGRGPSKFTLDNALDSLIDEVRRVVELGLDVLPAEPGSRS